MKPTIDRAHVIATLLEPYAFISDRDKFRWATNEPTAFWAYVLGTAEFVADALIANLESAYWRNKNPIESGVAGRAVRWFRESMAGIAGADESFVEHLAWCGAQGLYEAHETARVSKWLFEEGRSADHAIAYTSTKGPDGICEHFMPAVRERLLRGAYQDKSARAKACSALWRDDSRSQE